MYLEQVFWETSQKYQRHCFLGQLHKEQFLTRHVSDECLLSMHIAGCDTVTNQWTAKTFMDGKLFMQDCTFLNVWGHKHTSNRQCTLHCIHACPYCHVPCTSTHIHADPPLLLHYTGLPLYFTATSQTPPPAHFADQCKLYLVAASSADAGLPLCILCVCVLFHQLILHALPPMVWWYTFSHCSYTALN